MAGFERRVQQRQILALLLAIVALVLPISGALAYLDLLRDGGGPLPWITPFAGASNASEMIGPVLLVGAVGLGVAATRDRSAAGSVSVPVLATVVIVAGLSQGSAFFVSAFDLVLSDRYDVPANASWTAARWSMFARLLLQSVLCATVIAFGMRWLDPDDGRASP